MLRTWMKPARLLALAAALFIVSSCEGVPERAVTPAPEPVAPELEHTAPLLGLGPSAFADITLIRQPPLGGILRVAKLIGPEGGELSLHGHVLTVPTARMRRWFLRPPRRRPHPSRLRLDTLPVPGREMAPRPLPPPARGKWPRAARPSNAGTRGYSVRSTGLRQTLDKLCTRRVSSIVP